MIRFRLKKFFFLYYGRNHTEERHMLIYSMIMYIIFDHLPGGSARYLLCDVIVFPFAISILWGDIWRIHKYLVSH